MSLVFKTNGNTLKMAMLEKNMGLAELEQIAKVSRVTALKAINGQGVTLTTCNKIAKALCVPVTDLFTCD